MQKICNNQGESILNSESNILCWYYKLKIILLTLILCNNNSITMSSELINNGS